MAKRKINPVDQSATGKVAEVTLVTTASSGAGSAEHPIAAPSIADGHAPIPDLSLHAKITQAIAQAHADADHAKHGLLTAIENSVLDLSTRIATLDHDLSQDVQAIVDRIKIDSVRLFMALTKAQRDALPDSDFAVPGKRALPIHDATHVKMAWDSVSRTKGLTDDERKTAREKILSRAKDLGIDTGTWHITAFAFEAMSLEVPEVEDHPNKMPFSGVLTRVDQESDNPVGGAQGHRTMLTTAVAETALASLLGMAVDYTPALDGHDKTAKIGLITEATIEGDALHIAGFFYAADFPEECALIQAEKAKLGFSYECQARIQSLEADPWLIESCVFTGAAVLYKDKAAYTTTSLAAAAEKGLNMDKEELLAIMAEANKPLLDKVDQLAGKVNEIEAKGLTAGKEQHAVVRPHAEALRSAASAMEAAGIGGHPERGHVKVLRHMADSMEAEAMVGKIPHIYRDHDYLIGASAGKDAAVDTTKVVEEAIKAATAPLQASLDAAKTQITDLSAKAFNAAEGAQRKTITPEIKGLLAKHGLADTAEKGELTLDTVNKVLDAAGTKGQDAYTVKLRLMHSGLLSATTH